MEGGQSQESAKPSIEEVVEPQLESDEELSDESARDLEEAIGEDNQ